MKIIMSLLVSLAFFNLKSQLPINELINNTWYLESVETIDLNPLFNYLENPEYDHITLTFSMQNEILHYRTEVCAIKEGIVTEFFDGGESMIVFEESIISGNQCIDPDTNAFESSYFGHIFGEQYWYSITTESDGSLTLSLSSPNFCGASFTNQVLSTEEVSENNVILFPNPVKDKLTLENPDLKITNIQIINTEGKLILQQKINSIKTEIDFSALSKGIYFIRIESDGKIIKTEKVIKD